MKQRTITLHKLVRLKFERCKTVTEGIDHQWQNDLCDIQNLQADNNICKCLLVNIDVFFKICDCFSAEKQKCENCKKKRVCKIQRKQKPKAMQTDRGQ